MVALCLLLVILPQPSPGAEPRLLSAKTIPILAWVGPPAEQTTVERYRELADAGFTENFSGFPSADAMARALDVAQQAGIRQFVSTPELMNDPEGTARRFMDHPAIAGYHLRDEPSAGDFPALAQWARRIQSTDPRHGCYINLFPNYATPAQLGAPNYQAYVDRFVKEVPVPYLSFDHYPVTSGGLRGSWYENLEVISKAAREANKPFWAFALAVAHDPYPIARREHLRLQAFSDLAYGAECIQYFTYWTPVSTIWNFHQGPIEVNGARTIVYNRVREVNEEIQGLAPVFAGAQVVRVGHTGSVPRGTQPYQPEPPVREVNTGGVGALVSLLEKEGRRYLAIVNRDYTAPMPLTVDLAHTARVIEVRKDSTYRRLESRPYQANVPPGDVVVLGWDRKKVK